MTMAVSAAVPSDRSDPNKQQMPITMAMTPYRFTCPAKAGPKLTQFRLQSDRNTTPYLYSSYPQLRSLILYLFLLPAALYTHPFPTMMAPPAASGVSFAKEESVKLIPPRMDEDGNPKKPKKKHKSSNLKPMDEDTTTNPDPPVTMESYVSAVPIDDLHDISKMLTENLGQDPKEVKKPYTEITGDEDDSPDYAHDDLLHLLWQAGKLKLKSPNLSEEQKHALKQGILNLNEWISIMSQAVKHNAETVALLGHEESIKTLVTINRLAHTRPEALFRVHKDGINANNQSRAWRAAVMTLGSHYKKAKKQADIRDYGQNPENARSPSSELQGNPKQPKSNLRGGDKKAEAIVKDRSKQARYTMKFKIPNERHKSAQEVFLEVMRDTLEEFLTIDPKVAILPWKDKDLKTHKAITNPREIPDKIANFRAYVDRAKPKLNSDVWFKVHVACDVATMNFLSKESSSASSFFDAIECGSFFATVQDSDDPIEVAFLLYLGAFTDTTRLTSLLREASKKYNQGKEFRLGARVKKHKDIPASKEGFQDWIMAGNQIVTIECHRSEAPLVKTFLYKVFNENQVKTRLGHYNARALPVPSQINSGSHGNVTYVKSLRKHQAVMNSCKVAKSHAISSLTATIKWDGKEYSHLDILHSFTFPLCPAENEKSSSLFHCIDFASAGKDMAQGVTYFVAYKDRFELVEKLVAILPRLIEFRFDRKTAETFFHRQSIADCPAVTWDCGDKIESYAHWTGN